MLIESFPYCEGDRVETPDGPGTITRTWEPTSRNHRVRVNRDALAKTDLDPDVPRWAMSTIVALDSGRNEVYHALALKAI